MGRSLMDRVLDRLWVEAGRLSENKDPVPDAWHGFCHNGSVSGTTEWPLACGALALGSWSSDGFRRRRAVRSIVETLGPVDGRHFASWIRTVDESVLDHTTIRAANAWGDPVQAPGWVLGTRRSWSPTSLRYLAHALWLVKEGYLQKGGRVIEIGVGFGGLAAMLALVADAKVMLVDLPEVERAARLQMEELGLESRLVERSPVTADDLVISNYAFTELSESLQDAYIHEVLRNADQGVILSNAAMFSNGIGGRDNARLAQALMEAGIPVRESVNAEIIAPSDRMCGNVVLSWKRQSIL